MRGLQIAQLVAACIAALTPWIVVQVAFAVASSQSRSVQRALPRPATVTALGRLTSGALVVAVVAAIVLAARPLMMAAIDVLLFAVLAGVGLEALGAIDRASLDARETTATVREASLRPRRLRHYLPTAWRASLIAAESAALGLFVWRVTLPASDRRLLAPIAFAAFAPVFTWLYEVWMREIAVGGDVATSDVDARRRSRIARVFAMEVLLAAVCLGLAHALLDLNWDQDAVWGATISLAGAVVGVAGCALCVSSGLLGRRYRIV